MTWLAGKASKVLVMQATKALTRQLFRQCLAHDMQKDRDRTLLHLQRPHISSSFQLQQRFVADINGNLLVLPATLEGCRVGAVKAALESGGRQVLL